MAPPPFQLLVNGDPSNSTTAPAQRKVAPVQRKEGPVQRKATPGNEAPVQQKATPVQKKEGPAQRKAAPSNGAPIQRTEAPIQRDTPVGPNAYGDAGFDEVGERLEKKGLSGGRSVERGDSANEANVNNWNKITNQSGASAVLHEGGTNVQIGGDNANVQLGSETKTTGAITTGGISAISENFSGAKFAFTVPRSYPLELLGEKTTVDLEFKVEGQWGAEAKAGLEAHLKQQLATKDPRTLKQEDLFRGFSTQGEVFVGIKLAIVAGGKYTWEKKSGDEYKQQVMNSIDPIRSYMKGLGGFWAGAAHLLPNEQFTGILCKLLFGSGGNVPLGGLGAKIEGTAGAGAEAAFYAGYEDGQIKFKASAGATWGLGFGGGVEIGLNLIQGVLFGLVTSSQAGARAVGLVQKTLPHLIDMLDDETFFNYAIQFVNDNPALYNALVKAGELSGLTPKN